MHCRLKFGFCGNAEVDSDLGQQRPRSVSRGARVWKEVEADRWKLEKSDSEGGMGQLAGYMGSGEAFPLIQFRIEQLKFLFLQFCC